MDADRALECGDIITVSSTEGVMKASEASALVKGTPTAKKLNILQGEYNDNEYIASSTWDAVPIEVCAVEYMNEFGERQRNDSTAVQDMDS